MCWFHWASPTDGVRTPPELRRKGSVNRTISDHTSRNSDEIGKIRLCLTDGPRLMRVAWHLSATAADQEIQVDAGIGLRDVIDV